MLMGKNIAFSLLALLGGMSAYADIPAGMTEIVLEAHDVAGDGSIGFQWILDSSHSTFDDCFYEGSYSYFGDYSRFDKSIPENADAVKGTANKIVDGETRLLIPAGTYDWMVTWPDEFRINMARGKYATVDDFTFLDGKTYRLRLTEENGMDGWGYYTDMIVANDLSIEGITLPRVSDKLGTAEKISVKIRNNGTEEAGGFTLTYSVNGQPPVKEVFEETLAPGNVAEYTFAAAADLSEKQKYIIVSTVEAQGDMLPYNNTAEATTRNLEPGLPPVNEVFSKITADEFADRWITINNSGSDVGWYYSEWISNKDGENGAIVCQSPMSYEDTTGDDWLISMPLLFKAGPAHVVFSVSVANPEYTEEFQLYVGSSVDPADMRRIGQFSTSDNEWSDKAVNFNIDTEGVYYVAIRGVSDSAAGSFRIGDITISEGEFKGEPAMRLVKTLTPYSNCDLSAESRLGMRVVNKGTAALENYTLSALIGGEEYTCVLNEPIEPGSTVDIYMEQTFDFSTPGTYDVTLSLTGESTELTAGATIECYEPLTESPVTTNFTLQENTGIWHPMDAEAWNYEAYFQDFSATRHGKDAGLLSRGMKIEKAVRMKISYTSSGWWGTGLGIYMGLASEDPAGYRLVYSDDEVDNSPREVEFDTSVETPGNYSFVIADTGDPDSRSYLRLNEVVLSLVHDYDITLESAAGSLAPYTPFRMTGGKHAYTVTVTNRGTSTMSGISVEATIDGNKAGTSTTKLTLDPGATGKIDIDVDVPEKEVGETLELSFAVSGDMEDAYTADNVLNVPKIYLTESTYANENISYPENGTGNDGMTLAVGNIYRLASVADVTSMTVGLCEASEEMMNCKGDIRFSVHKVEGNVPVKCLYSETRKRGTGGIIEIDFPDMRLDAGEYYFEVEQMSTYNMGLAFDPDNYARCYTRDEAGLTAMNAPALMIRAQFAPDARVYAKDAAVKAFTAPVITDMLFSNSTTVAVTARNSGYENADFSIELKLDGAKVGEKNVSLSAYEEQEVVFEDIDLSVPGTHCLAATTCLANDENSSNDSLSLEIVSQEEADPYMMDFERCADFSAAGDSWNPRWTTIDRNGVNTDLFWRYQHPHRGEPCGFMAFNPAATEPSMVDNGFEGFYPHSGERFGVAFHYDPWSDGAEELTQSDVWIISPKLQLGNGSSFELYVKTRMLESRDAELEPYRVLVSDTDDAPDSFTTIGDDVRRAAVEDWEEVSVDLSEYDGKAVYVAVQYIGAPRGNTCLMIDDLLVKTDISGMSEISRTESAVITNGRDIIAPEGSRVYTIDGTETGTRALTPGVYIVKTPSRSVKVAIR